MGRPRRAFPWALLLGVGVSLAASAPAADAGRTVRTPAELTAAAAQAQPGDTLILADGVWQDAELRLTASGSAAQPILIRAETPGGVTLAGRTWLHLGGRYVTVSGLRFRVGATADRDVVEFRNEARALAEDCRLTECAIEAEDSVASERDSRWVSLYGQRNRADHCAFTGKTNGGSTLVVWVGTSPNDHRLDHNWFGPRQRLGENGGETLRVGTSDVSLQESRTVVEHNLFEECNGEIEIISNKSCGNIYRYNTFRRCEGTLTLRHGNRCTVLGNWFFGAGAKHSGGVRIIGEDHLVTSNYFADLGGKDARAALAFMQGIPDSPLSGYLQVKRATVSFNTLVNCRCPLAIGVKGGGTSLPPLDCVIANNVIADSPGAILTTTMAPEGWTWQGNVAWGGQTEALPALGFRLVAPALERDGAGIWRPVAASPLRGSASGAAPATDIDGQPRLEPLDAGCDQVSSAPVCAQPLDRSQVGPAWLHPAPP